MPEFLITVADPLGLGEDFANRFILESDYVRVAEIAPAVIASGAESPCDYVLELKGDILDSLGTPQSVWQERGRLSALGASSGSVALIQALEPFYAASKTYLVAASDGGGGQKWQTGEQAAE